MSRRDATMLVGLSLIWGASWMFIKVADRQFDPAVVVWLRLVLACAVLVPAALAVVGRDALAQARASWPRLASLGVVNSAVPFLLIAWAETRIDSALAAILQAVTPIFTVTIATRLGDERLSSTRVYGVLTGLAGVALLFGTPGGRLLAMLAVVGAALSYAVGAVLGSRAIAGAEPLVVGASSTVAAMLLTAPLGLARLPATLPGWKECASVAALGLAGTGVAYVILFALLRSAGPSRTMLTTYLIPAAALVYGVLLLGEPLRAVSLAGLALILAGVALAAGGERAGPRRRARFRRF